MLGKWQQGGVSYLDEAEKTGSSYFNLGEDWSLLQQQYKLTNDDLFDMLNIPVLDDAIDNGKVIKFSHDPRKDLGALGKEWNYLKKNGYTTVVKQGSYWIAK